MRHGRTPVDRGIDLVKPALLTKLVRVVPAVRPSGATPAAGTVRTVAQWRAGGVGVVEDLCVRPRAVRIRSSTLFRSVPVEADCSGNLHRVLELLEGCLVDAAVDNAHRTTSV